MNYNTLMGLYDKYWEAEYIDVDIANNLANAVPELIDRINELENMLNEVTRETSNSLE